MRCVGLRKGKHAVTSMQAAALIELLGSGCDRSVAVERNHAPPEVARPSFVVYMYGRIHWLTHCIIVVIGAAT